MDLFQNMGRVDAVYMNPLDNNEILIGTAASGIWKTTDGGLTWLNKTDDLNFPVLGVDNFALKPNDPSNNTLIASSDLGKILITNDFGDNWTELTSFYNLLDYSNVLQVGYDPINSDHIFALVSVTGHQSRLWHSDDGGVSWEIVYFTSNTNSDNPDVPYEFIATGFQITSSGRLFVFNENKWSASGKIMYSDDFGSNWDGQVTWNDAIDNGILSGITQQQLSISTASTERNGEFVIGSNLEGSTQFAFFKSTDGGINFSPADIYNGLQSDPRSDKFFIQHRDNSDQIFIGLIDFFRTNSVTGNANSLTSNTIYSSTTGATFHDDVREIQYLKNSLGEDIYVIGHDGGIALYNAVTNQRTSLNGPNLPISETKEFGITQNSNPQIIIGNQDGGTHRYFENSFGLNWYWIYDCDGGESGFNRDGSKAYYQCNGTYTTEGFGYSFTSSGNGISGNQNYPLAKAKDDNSVYIGGSGNPGGIIKSSLGASPNYLNIPGSRTIFQLELCSNDENLIYASNIGVWPDYSSFYRIENDLGNIIELNNGDITNEDGSPTGKILSDLFNRSTVVSAIESNPKDENNVFIGLSGATFPDWAEEEDTWRILESENGGQTWKVYSEGLPLLPINRIVYYENSNDLIFAATDIGVYYRDATMTSWECMRNGMPPVIVTDLEINYCNQKLYASTYGRGVWESDIPNFNSFEEIIVEANELWDSDLYLYSDIVIQAPAELTISSVIEMGANKRITVEPGARLIVDNGTITNSCPNDLWGGIYVEGNSSIGQGSHVNSPMGYLELSNGSKIEHATTAIHNYALNNNGGIDWSKTGGVVRAFDSDFLNNRRDVEFLSYQNLSPGGYLIPDLSVFENCDFSVNNDYFGPEDIWPNLTFWGCSDVKIKGCDLHDDRSDLEPFERRDGILSGASSLKINANCNVIPPQGTECPVGDLDRNTFSDLNHGISLYNTGNVLFNYNIRNSDFIGNWRGIYMRAIDNAEIWENNFEVTPYEETAPSELQGTVGLYIDNQCRNYHVEENDFYPDETSQGLPGIGLGIVVNNNHGDNTEIYNNHIRYLNVGVEGIGINRSDAGQTHKGLQIRCNDLLLNHSDIFAYPGNYVNAGISQDQGYATPDPDDWANNNFNQSFIPGTTLDLDNEAQFFNYRFDEDEPEEEPLALFGPINLDALESDNTETKCLTKIPRRDRLEIKSNIENGFTGMLDKQALLYSLLDGGDTEQMQTDVVLTNNNDAWLRYVQLMNEAGYLSEEVLIEVSRKETGFTNGMIRDILVANPLSAKSQNVQEELDERANQLPQYMRDQIALGLDQMAPSEFIQMQKDAFKYDFDNATNELYLRLIQDTLPPDSLLSFIDLLSGTGDLSFDYKMVEVYDAFGEDLLASSLLNLMENYSTNSDAENDEIERYKKLSFFNR